MTASHFLSAHLLIAYTAYFVGTASPGPSNLAIMSIAANHGRKPALTFALGVISGSLFWAIVAMLGVSATLLAYSHFLVAIKLFGGAYLLWLAFKSGRAALRPSNPADRNGATSAFPADADGTLSLRRLYLRGALLHLTNPKAVLVWMSIVALSSGPDGAMPTLVVPGCAAIGMAVFCGYAVLFSTRAARRLYLRVRRWLDGCLAVVFGVAGWQLLISRTSAS
ncbi:LysE family translocator [Pandoraea pulmonicola]|uniref:Lysine transporter LysE n=1 Tax=Pandoraea pulmonicola TaxID=93221 RepID=A0AAJ4ZFX5_PANPU|nr:LysE family translocator [Pandoraea pulmonicola]AJC19480.1 lysine transporter LysE [Pandoraea pulmonicola]SUA92476.1 Threonine efflux protein [Pandoraea pulmonicola]